MRVLRPVRKRAACRSRTLPAPPTANKIPLLSWRAQHATRANYRRLALFAQVRSSEEAFVLMMTTRGSLRLSHAYRLQDGKLNADEVQQVIGHRRDRRTTPARRCGRRGWRRSCSALGARRPRRWTSGAPQTRNGFVDELLDGGTVVG